MLLIFADVDECSRGLDNCGSNSECSNTIGSFSCICNHGFTGDGVTCGGRHCNLVIMGNSILQSAITSCSFLHFLYFFVDIDECSLSIDNCRHHNRSCINIDGSFLCTGCGSGYSWNRTACEGKRLQ